MSQDFAGKTPQRLSKFSNAGDDAFRRTSSTPLPAIETEQPVEAPAEILPEMVEAALAHAPAQESPAQEFKRKFSRFSEDTRPLYGEVAAQAGFAEPQAVFEQPAAPYGDHPYSNAAQGYQDYEQPAPAYAETAESSSRLIAELGRIQRTGTGQSANVDYALPDEPMRERALEAAEPVAWVTAAETSAPRAAAPQASAPQVKQPRTQRGAAKTARPVSRNPLKFSLPGIEAHRRIAGRVKAAAGVTRLVGARAIYLTGKAPHVASNARSLIQVARAKKLSARYRMGLAALHTGVLDRKVERLLFVRSRPPVEDSPEAAPPSKDYRFQGAIPRLVLNWALSPLPEDLKTYAFVDFRAGNGRTMLLAARRNFEVIIGYAFDAQTYEDLEMNIAQYPRSLMACRDLRALRGDLEGIAIPEQPCVLFFPDCTHERHLNIMLNHVASSFRLNPRPLYLIFDNIEKDMRPEQEDIFQPVALPVADRLKLALLSPARVRVYRSVLMRSA